MSNILFVLYHDFTSNSAVHVHNFGNQLASFGHSVAVAVPDNQETVDDLGQRSYRVAAFPQFDGVWLNTFPDGTGPDVVHAWTPRENVRLFCEKLKGFATFKLVIHLEDNEELILEANLGEPFEKLAKLSSSELPGNLSHPRSYRRFLAAADGVTIIMDRLAEFVPAATPRLVLWPGAETTLFYPRAKDTAQLASLGVPPENLILCYTGNVHSANAHDVRSLYVAVAMLNREGTPATLLRAGGDYCSFLGPDEAWARQHSIDLGYIKHPEVPELLGLADFLVQPGNADAFNDFRLPAKLPEFFAMGRPVILPHSNAGRFTRHGEHAWVLPKVDALGIVEAVETLLRDRALTEQLAKGAHAFSREHFDWGTNTASLQAFYEKLGVKQTSAPAAEVSR